MKDLRKWSDIKQALLDYHNSLTMSRYITEEDCRNARFAVEGALYALEDVPAVDAVEVVRCSECKHKEDCFSQIGFWSRDYILEQNNYEYHKLDFCSYGEKKGE